MNSDPWLKRFRSLGVDDANVDVLATGGLVAMDGDRVLAGLEGLERVGGQLEGLVFADEAPLSQSVGTAWGSGLGSGSSSAWVKSKRLAAAIFSALGLITSRS